jgi:CRISPR-associated protein Cmr2
MSNNIDLPQHFHFTLAPVQAFIAQARRTRDFWTGSFILSWLSAVAMQAVEKQEGCTIIFPKPDADYLRWLEGESEGEPPTHGGVPNRFKAKVQEGFKPETVVDAVNQAWQALADAVYDGDLKAINNDKTKKIWNRQVNAFWEMNWVLTGNAEDSAALDVRKNWRSYLPPAEAGVKCMMMDGWQELSGVDRASDKEAPKSSKDETLLKIFWLKVRDNTKVKGMKTDLREGEHLCAIAFIKRRFPRYFHEVKKEMPNNWTLKSWKVNAGRPSVAYMAAVHWLEDVLKQANDNEEISRQLRQFRYKAFKLTKGQYNEWDNQIHCLKAFDKHRKWLALDGNVFFESALENANIYENQTQAGLVLKELKALQKLMPDLPAATPFYAVLMMDGDSLGRQMSDMDKQETITQGLKNFTDHVPELVKLHNGFLIYAGGDDVLAVLPLEDALGCALAVREKYTHIFADKFADEKTQVFTSISAAVVFAHIKMPLTKVLKEAHKLLDNIAKEEYGRDSLAVSVWKPGSMVLQWARPWDMAIENQQLIINKLANDFAKDDKDDQLGNKFLYKIRERFELLNPDAKGVVSVLSTEQAIDLMAVEYVSSGVNEKITLNHAKEVVRPLLKQCRPIYRKLDDANVVTWEESNKVMVDAALLVRFLAQKGVNL